MEKESQHRKQRVILAITGSVAAIKAAELVKELLRDYEVKLVISESARRFIQKEQLEQLTLAKVEYLFDEDETLRWNKRGDPVLHIQLRKWADALLIAPLSANTLAKITAGICDNLVTLICRCWDMKLKPCLEGQQQQAELIKPILVAPAMNTMMWEHHITNEQLKTLKKWGFKIIDPIQKVLVCGDQGKGAMAHLTTIVSILHTTLLPKQNPCSTYSQ